MSAFSRYAARSERATSLNLRTPISDLAEVFSLLERTTPVSGDMIATLARGTRTQQYRRRLRAIGSDPGEARS